MSEIIEFQFKHIKTGEVKTITLSFDEIQEKLEDDLIDEITCDCEPVGETNVVECGCEDYFEGFNIVPRNLIE